MTSFPSLLSGSGLDDDDEGVKADGAAMIGALLPKLATKFSGVNREYGELGSRRGEWNLDFH